MRREARRWGPWDGTSRKEAGNFLNRIFSNIYNIKERGPASFPLLDFLSFAGLRRLPLSFFSPCYPFLPFLCHILLSLSFPSHGGRCLEGVFHCLFARLLFYLYQNCLTIANRDHESVAWRRADIWLGLVTDTVLTQRLRGAYCAVWWVGSYPYTLRRGNCALLCSASSTWYRALFLLFGCTYICHPKSDIVSLPLPFLHAPWWTFLLATFEGLNVSDMSLIDRVRLGAFLW